MYKRLLRVGDNSQYDPRLSLLMNAPPPLKPSFQDGGPQ